MMKKKWIVAAVALSLLCFTVVILSSYRRPYREIVINGGIDPSLVYAVMKAESGFREDAVSKAGAIGLMQLLPSTAEFICCKHQLEFFPEKLKEGAYNVKLGCLYLAYLTERFTDILTVIAAYNAGEGVVSKWLEDDSVSPDGIRLDVIPYPETAQYVKKVEKFWKIYGFLYH